VSTTARKQRTSKSGLLRCGVGLLEGVCSEGEGGPSGRQAGNSDANHAPALHL
jgi:hypothetical protein